MIQNCAPTLINNTITQNRCTNASTSAIGGGLHVYSGGPFNGVNNIVYDNYATLNPEIYGAVDFNYSCSSVSLSGTGNITSNPQFISPTTDDFHLQPTSLCIDTGDPASPLDPDNTRADMGALYYNHSATPPNLDVTLTPINPPIQVPAQGGSFNFTASVVNHGPLTPFTVWARIKNPDGSYTNPTLGPVQICPPVNVNVSRMRTQTVPGSWAPGVYTYLGYGNLTLSYPAIDSSSFAFTKLTVADDGPFVWEASCTGDPFPYEVSGANSVAYEFRMIGAYPNPFNPTTTISFTLPEAGLVMLTVWDANGREVAALVNGARDAGQHNVTFDGSSLASGMYIYTLTASGQTAAGKMMLVK